MGFTTNQAILTKSFLQQGLLSLVLLFIAGGNGYRLGLVSGFILYILLTYWSKRKAPLERMNYLIFPRASKIFFAILAPLVIIWWVLIQKSSIDQVPWLMAALVALLILVITSNRLSGRDAQEAR